MRRVIAIAVLSLFAAAAALLAPWQQGRAEAGTTSPPAHYFGSIQVQNMTVANGDQLHAETWSGLNCGTATVYAAAGATTLGYFFMTIESEDSQSGCFESGEPIIFKFKGVKAQEIPVWSNWGSQQVDLTFKARRIQQCTPALCPLSSKPVLVLPSAR